MGDPKAATPPDSLTPAWKMTFPESCRSLLSADCTARTWALPNVMRLYTQARLHIAVWKAQEEEAVISSPHPSFDERMVTVTRPDLEGLLQSITAALMKWFNT